MVFSLQSFFNTFTAELANTQAVLEETYRLRYQIYCEQLGWEQGDCEQEIDAYDSSAHVITFRHNTTEKLVAMCRVLPATRTQAMPFEAVVTGALYPDLEERLADSVERPLWVETSRAMALPSFRRIERLLGPAALTGGIVLAGILQAKYVATLMQPGLVTRMRRFGIQAQVGSYPIEYNETRRVYWNRFKDILEPGSIAESLYVGILTQIKSPSFEGLRNNPPG